MRAQRLLLVQGKAITGVIRVFEAKTPMVALSTVMFVGAAMNRTTTQ
jgi:hypothetical protein